MYLLRQHHLQNNPGHPDVVGNLGVAQHAQRGRAHALAQIHGGRRDAALLCHAVEAGRPVRRRLYGSSKVALPNFGENEENEAPLGAVRTWGRAECRVLLENAHGRVVGAAVSMSSLLVPTFPIWGNVKQMIWPA